MKPFDIISYAADVTSFLIRRLPMEDVKEIVLFGSASRREAGRRSDIDLFIDVSANEEKIEKMAGNLKDEFFDSVRFKRYWKLLGMTNDIHLVVGRLAEWALKQGASSTGITLYGKHRREPEKTRARVLFAWENVRPEGRRVHLDKTLFGYRARGKRYPGLVKKYGAERVGKGSILVDAAHYTTFLALFRQLKITVTIRRVWEEM